VSDFLTTGSLPNAGIPRKAMRILERLKKLTLNHLHVTNERSGFHVYVPCPVCLKKRGSRELTDQHMAINLDRFLGTGKWVSRRGTVKGGGNWSAYCHREDRPDSIENLLKMPSVDRVVQTEMADEPSLSPKERYLIDDGKGNRIPDHPGDVTPIIELPEDHHAVQYLLRRNYNLQQLWEQFRCSYCTREKHPYHRRLPGGFKDTPQGRIIFYCDMDGVQQGWQARIIDRIEGDGHFYWHPYNECWSLVEIKEGRNWALQPEFADENSEGGKLKWKPSKYKTATGMLRSQCLLGLDAALAWNALRGTRVALMAEGPLDVGRYGAPGMPLLGKCINNEQVHVLRKHFNRLVWIGDTDGPGAKCTAQVCKALGGHMKVNVITLPAGIKDMGELSPEEAQVLFEALL
jgi:hypothetical protein